MSSNDHPLGPDLQLQPLAEFLRRFASERAWEPFHTPKNLAMALSGEVGELAELFQWLTAEESQAIMQSPSKAECVRDELADVLVYCVRLADVLGIDLSQAVWRKVQKNAEKYPVHLAKGNALKYDEL